MLKISDLKIDVSCLGGKYWLTEVIPAYAYKDGQRTNEVIGFRYSVALPQKNLDKVQVRIDGKQLLDNPATGYVEVTFTGLEVFLYWQSGTYQIGARAAGIALAANKT